MTAHVGSEYARQHLAELLERAARGERIVVTRRNRALAAIVPLADAQLDGGAPNILDLEGSGAGLWGDDAARYVDEAREEWT